MNPLDLLNPVASSSSSPRLAKASASGPVDSYSEDNGKTEKNISVRKIDNGFIVRETIIDRSNDSCRVIKESERFSKTKPSVEVKK